MEKYFIRILKRLLSQVMRKTIQGWKNLFHAQSILLSATKYAQKRLCSNTLKKSELKLNIFLKGNVLEKAKAHFRYTIWFMISKKWDIKRCTFLRCEHEVAPKVSTRYIKKLCTRISNSLSPEINDM